MRLERQKGKPRITEGAVWIDLLNPTPEEEVKVERALKLDVPTREEQQEIEASSRLYQEDGAYFMTATLLYQPEQGEPRTTPVTFILAGQRLVTVRYARAAGLLDLCGALQPRRPGSQERDHRADRPAGNDHRPARGFHRAHPSRGGRAVAFDFRDQGRRRIAATAFRRDVAGDRARGRDHLEGPRKRPFVRPAADLSRSRRQRAEGDEAACRLASAPPRAT